MGHINPSLEIPVEPIHPWITAGPHGTGSQATPHHAGGHWRVKVPAKSSPWSHHDWQGVWPEQGLIFEGEAGHEITATEALGFPAL